MKEVKNKENKLNELLENNRGRFISQHIAKEIYNNCMGLEYKIEEHRLDNNHSMVIIYNSNDADSEKTVFVVHCKIGDKLNMR